MTLLGRSGNTLSPRMKISTAGMRPTRARHDRENSSSCWPQSSSVGCTSPQTDAKWVRKRAGEIGTGWKATGGEILTSIGLPRPSIRGSRGANVPKMRGAVGAEG